MTLEEYRQSLWGDIVGSLKESPRVAADVGQIATGGIARFADRMTGGAFPALTAYGEGAKRKRREYEELVTQSPDISPEVAGMWAAGMDVGKAATEQLAMSGAANLAGRAIQGVGAARGAMSAKHGLNVADKAHQVALHRLAVARASGNPAKIKAATDAAKTAWQARGAAAGAAKAITTTPGQAFRAGASVAPQFGTKATLLGRGARMIPPAVDAFGVDESDYAQRVAAVGGGLAESPAGKRGPVSTTVDQVLEQQGVGQQQHGFQSNIEDTYSKLGDVAAGGGRTVLPNDQRGVFLNGYRYGGANGVSSSEIANARTDAGIAPDVVATPVVPGRAGAFAVRRTPDGEAYVVGSEADPMRAYRAANRERYQDIASELRTGGAKPLPTAAEIADKREFDRRRALIETMAEGPDKQDALARLQDEQTARAELSPFDRFEGLKGSPDAKAREGRMAAYQAKLDQLTAERVITKREAAAAMGQAEKAKREQFKFDQAVLTAEQKQEDKAVENELLQTGLVKKSSIAAANAGFRSMATFNGKINGKGPNVNGAQVTEMFIQLEPETRIDVLREAARNVEHYEMDPRAAFMAALVPVLNMQLRQQQS